MSKSKDGQGRRPIQTKEGKTGDGFTKNQRSTYQGPKGPVDTGPGNTLNPTPTQAPASPAPTTDQGGDGGGSDK